MQAVGLVRLDGEQLARALRGGVQRVVREREHLDRINVFPVPDGDTGTNLAITLGAVLPVLQGAPGAHAGQLLVKVADAALDGARGNSGAILAQFLLGLGDRAGHLGVLTPAEFAAAVAGGAAYAREALAAPREGTILTVLSDVAVELGRLAAGRGIDFTSLLDGALIEARRSLQATREQLAELRDAGVVDAGAAGFVSLLEGMAGYFASGTLEEPELGDLAAADERDAAGGEAPLEHRWCTECLVAGPALDRRRLRERLAALGSSLVVAGTQAKARIHVHVSDPQAVFRIAAEFGTVSGQKADDMQRQQESALRAARRRVAIVTDSAADVPEEELERLDINLVPCRVHFGERSFLDKVTLGPEEFYRLLATDPEHPKTSQPPAGDFRRMFEFLASHYESVLSIDLSGRVSGTRQAAEAAALRSAASARVRVIDSRNASTGQGLIAMYAAECADAGLGAAELAERVLAILPLTRTYACLATLDYAVRGGRVAPLARTLARLLSLAPLLTTAADGRLTIGGVLIGRANLTAKFARFVGRRLKAEHRYRLLVGHGDAPAEGARLLALLKHGRSNIDRAWLVPLGTALGVHGGPGMLIVGLQQYTPPSPPAAAIMPGAPAPGADRGARR